MDPINTAVVPMVPIDPTCTINLLNTKIQLLKNNIQDIINKQKKIENNNVESDENKKQEYLVDLDNTINELRELKLKISLSNDYRKALRTNDSMSYHRVKNKSNSVELIQELKRNREIAQDNFEKMKLVEIEYIEKEGESTTPGFLFFNKNIVDRYGLCPYIRINFDKRKEWLDIQRDNGKLYYDFYEEVINKSKLHILNNNKIDLEEKIYKTHNDFFTEEQLKLYKLICESVIEYINYPIKTKKLKDKFKIIINNVTSLVTESNLNINIFLSLFYEIHIPINKQCSNENKFIYEIYEKLLEDYNTVIEDIKSVKKFIFNTNNYLKQLLYEYLFNELENDKKIIEKTENINLQTGKYFKKWSLMNNEEKNERYKSFSTFFVDKFLVQPNLVDSNKADMLTSNLNQLLTDEFKNIKYKHLKWNVKSGCLDQIYCLKYNNETEEFYIEINKDKTLKNKQVKKPSSIKTILHKENEKIINEEIVIFIIICKNNKNLSISSDITVVNLLKNEFIEHLKLKMKLKRITINDKLQIIKKFDDIFNVICNVKN